MTLRKAIYSLMSIIIFSATLRAEVICTVDLNYKWERKEGQEAELVYWKSFESRAKVEDDARASLQHLINDGKIKAYEICKKEHENLSSCVASKYAAMAGALEEAGFSARKNMEFAISADCQRSLGLCKEPAASEIKCVTKEEPKPAEADTAKEGKKDAKKK